MKKIFKTLAIVAVAALGFACQNEIDEQVNGNEGEKVTVEVVGSVADLTRSVFGAIDTEKKTVPSTWSGNEQVGFSAAEAALVAATNTAAAGATASFSVEFAAIADGDTVYAVSPYNTGSWALGGFSGISAKNDDFYVTIPVEQTPLATSVDESAHLMIGQATYEEGSTMAMTFEHVAAYAKMNITNFGGNGVKEIAVTFPTNVVGQGAWCYYAGEKVGTIANLQSNTVTINPENVSNFANGVWFTVAPVGALVGDMKVVVTDEDDKTYTKNIALTAEKGISFVKGQVSEFTVNMNGVTEDVVEGSYNRITELSQLTDGCEAVIVAQKGGSYYALTANGTNRPSGTVVTINGETLDNASLKDALVMTVGVSNGNYTFKNGSSYLVSNDTTTPHFNTNGNTTFTIAANGEYFNVKNTTDNRYIALWTSKNDWRAYTDSAYSGSVSSLSFYVKGAKADTRLQSSLSFSQESYEVDLNGFSGTFTAPEKTLNPNGGTLTYSSSNEAVATVVAATGDVEIIGVGTAVITATFDGNDEYKGCSAEYTITVVDTRGGKASFVKVTSAPADWSGTYLIVYESGKLAFDGSRTTLDAVSNTVSVTISNNEIEATDAMKAAAFTVVKNGSNYNIQSASGYYIGQTSNKNGLTSNKSTKYSNTLSVNNDASVNVVSGGAYLRYNATSGQTRFRYFKSGTYTSQKAIHFYKLVE